jgi:GLPGLI family protein
MKNLILIIVILLQVLSAYCQKVLLYDFKVQYAMQLNFNNYSSYNAILYFNNTQSLFEYQETSLEKEITEEEIRQKFNKGDNISFNIRIRDTVHYYTKYDRETNMIYEFIRGFKKNEFYEVKESAPTVNWTITDEKKKIDQYDCTKATCSFRGRFYTAWFTTAIQTNFGPIKLHGLPGLIIVLNDKDKEVMLSVKVVKKEETIFKNEQPINAKTISRSEFNQIKADGIKKLEEMLNRISSKSERGFKMTGKINSIKSIEMD